MRYLLANLGELRTQTVLREFTIAVRQREIVDELLIWAALPATATPVIGFRVYLECPANLAVIRQLRVDGRQCVSCLVSARSAMNKRGRKSLRWPITSFPGSGGFYYAGSYRRRTGPGFLAGEIRLHTTIRLPYDEYSDADTANRLLYVEASLRLSFSV